MNMTMSTTVKGALLASTVAGLFACATPAAQQSAAPMALTGSEVKCEGINECKGHGSCGGGAHHCAGQNECKGKGWMKEESKEACEAKGGKAL